MLPEFKDIEKAARRIEGFAVRTPVLESPKLNAITGGRILIKAECLQRTGSFKFRGAWNMISKLDAKKTKGGVVAYSSGNHAQGVAYAARHLGLDAQPAQPIEHGFTGLERHLEAVFVGGLARRAGIAVDHRLEGYFEVETELAGAQAVNRGKA